MRYSERLLLKAETEALARRTSIARFEKDLDALGELLSTAHYEGIQWSTTDPATFDDCIQINNHTKECSVALLRFLLAHGGIIERQIESRVTTCRHYTLRLPNVGAPVVYLVPLDLPIPEDMVTATASDTRLTTP
ncbi:hypothetical protein LBW62_15175 [Ralstonia solanacearum]|uniref:hypothetical protein n=1 Tax=Ralstonia solanacearum TaxID=305 RepID=UPI000A7D34B6|nr:hypothetical protein [Ralstonia solanacearum]MDB0544080.1 hypothetical protein [Ralstonia solanacearum]MDB0552713.1 hypothetical protein [Ralstonia solanacearum]MDB0557533.1 hypothetical protein [Ralstonia solanacearum]